VLSNMTANEDIDAHILERFEIIQKLGKGVLSLVAGICVLTFRHMELCGRHAIRTTAMKKSSP